MFFKVIKAQYSKHFLQRPQHFKINLVEKKTKFINFYKYTKKKYFE